MTIKGGYYGRYLPSGHVLYMHEGTLLAVPFDLARLEATGAAVPVIEDLAGASITAGLPACRADDTKGRLPTGRNDTRSAQGVALLSAPPQLPLRGRTTYDPCSRKADTVLDSGTRLGPYEIVAPLGAGGMG